MPILKTPPATGGAQPIAGHQLTGLPPQQRHRTALLRRWPARLAVAGALVLLSACSPRLLIVHSMADELASQGSQDEEDPVLAREAGAFYLKLSESVLRQTPEHLQLSASVAAGFTQYAYAFVAFEADKLDARDAKAAHRLRQRAARLYLRAQRHAMAALEQRHPGFRAALASAAPADWPQLDAAEVGLAYWAAAAWGGHIALSKDQPDVVADLPLAVRLATLAWQLQPEHGDGALASLMGSFEAARPGGSAAQAGVYFDRAIAVSGGRSPGAFVAKAEGWAQPAGDRTAFEALLRQALQAGANRTDLVSSVMGERARWLLDSADDLF